jgi:hypothetical protein
MLCLEAESVALAVGHQGVVVRLRGVIRQSWIGRRGGRIPVDEPGLACYRCPPSGFWGVLVVEKESLDWRRFEGKRLGERQGAPTVLFIGVAERSWPWIVVHIPRNLEGGEASLTESSSGRLEFKLSHIRLTGSAKLRSEWYSGMVLFD